MRSDQINENNFNKLLGWGWDGMGMRMGWIRIRRDENERR